jgi:hypothetical protein
MGSGRTEKERVGEAVERYGNKAVEELVDELVEEETPWDQVLPTTPSTCGRCPVIDVPTSKGAGSRRSFSFNGANAFFR